MIFVTVGGQGPFARLVGAVDAWAAREGRSDVFAQVGATAHPPRHIAWEEFLSPGEFRRRVAEADLVVSHAGMGTILTALEHETPILVMPRRASAGEQRNDHQVDTARRLREVAGIPVAADEDELVERLSRLDEIARGALRGEGTRQGLIDAIARFASEA